MGYTGKKGKDYQKLFMKSQKMLAEGLEEIFKQLTRDVPAGVSVAVTISDEYNPEAVIFPLIVDRKSNIRVKGEVINLDNITVLRHLLPQTKYRELYEKYFGNTTEMGS